MIVVIVIPPDLNVQMHTNINNYKKEIHKTLNSAA